MELPWSEAKRSRFPKGEGAFSTLFLRNRGTKYFPVSRGRSVKRLVSKDEERLALYFPEIEERSRFPDKGGEGNLLLTHKGEEGKES